MTTAEMVFCTVQVVGHRKIGPSIIRVTFQAAELSKFATVSADQQVKLFFPQSGFPLSVPQPKANGDLQQWHSDYLAIPDIQRPWLRTYSIRAARTEVGEVDIDFALHDFAAAAPGPATAWASTVQLGQELGFFGPAVSHFRPWGSHPWRLLIGDSSSFGAIGAILAAAPVDTPISVICYGETDSFPPPSNELGWEMAPQRSLRWVPSLGRDCADALVSSLRETPLADQEGHIWLAGEAGAVRAARRHLVNERHFPKENIAFTGYWRQRLTADDDLTGADQADQDQADEDCSGTA